MRVRRLVVVVRLLGGGLLGILVPVLAAMGQEQKTKSSCQAYENHKNRPNSPSGHVLGRIAALRLLVVHAAGLAAQVARLHAVQAHVELLAVGRVRELGVRDRLAVLVVLLQRLLAALEAVLHALGVRVASLPARRVRPHAGARVLVKVQALRALDLDRLAVDAVEEDVADGRVGVREEAVLARAQARALRLLCGGGGGGKETRRISISSKAVSFGYILIGILLKCTTHLSINKPKTAANRERKT